MVKKHKKIKNENLKISQNNLKKYFEKYPGFYAAIIFSIIILIAYFLIIFGETTNQRSMLAKELSEEINYLTNKYIADIDYSLENETDYYGLEEYYLISMKREFEWLKTKEKEAYNLFPLNEAEHRELAIYLFIDYLLNLNEIVTFDFGEPDFENEINTAKSTSYETPDFISEELDQIWIENEDKNKIKNYFMKILNEYIQEKRHLIEILTLNEMKYVESKKYNYLNYFKNE
jgi:hypothetical protein